MPITARIVNTSGAVSNGMPAVGGALSSMPIADLDAYSLPPEPQRVITTRPQVPIEDQELRARIQWGHRTSSHFDLAYDRVRFTEPQVTALTGALEEAYNLVFHFTHESFTDRYSVFAIDERAISLLGRVVRPHFNANEQAFYLVECSRHHAAEEIARLVTHAMRSARYTRHYGTTPGWAALEEGFGIFLAERFSLASELFPFYGAEPDVIASHLTQEHTGSIARLWSGEASELSPCDMAMLGAFFLFLGDTFSDDRIVQFSKSEDPITSETFRAFFRESLEELDYAWHQRLPLSLLSLTQEEKETMIARWKQAIE